MPGRSTACSQTRTLGPHLPSARCDAVGSADLIVSATGTDNGRGVVYLLAESTLLDGASEDLLLKSPPSTAMRLVAISAVRWLGLVMSTVMEILDIIVSLRSRQGGTGNPESLPIGQRLGWPPALMFLSAMRTRCLRESRPALISEGRCMDWATSTVMVSTTFCTRAMRAVGTVHSGSTDGLAADSVVFQLHGSSEMGHERGRVLPAGDINGDGRTDIVFIDEEYVEFFVPRGERDRSGRSGTRESLSSQVSSVRTCSTSRAFPIATGTAWTRLSFLSRSMALRTTGASSAYFLGACSGSDRNSRSWMRRQPW